MPPPADHYVGGVEVEQHKLDHRWIADRRVIERFLVGVMGLNLGALIWVIAKLVG